MELEYDKLDEILKYLYENPGYKGWQMYQRFVASRDNILIDTINTDTSFAGWCNSLLHWGLVDYKFDGNHLHTYIINPTGSELVVNQISTKEFHQTIKNRERLQNKVLEGTIESYSTARSATTLNKLQLIVTIILGVVSASSIAFQFESNKIAKEAIEISKKAYELEVARKGQVDTIVTRVDNNATSINDGPTAKARNR